MSPATPHMQKLKPGSPRQGTRGLNDARPPGPVAKHQPQRRTGAAAWEAGGGTGPAGVAGADRRLRAGPAGPARHAAGEGDVHGCPPGAAGRPRQVLPSFLRTALGPSCGRCQAHLASALAAPGTAKAEVPARIDPKLQARGFPRAVRTCHLARPPTHPACVSEGPHEAQPKGGLWNKVAEAKVRVKGPLQGSKPLSSLEGLPCLCPPPPPCHPFCLSALRGWSRHHPSKPSPEHPHACLGSRVPVQGHLPSLAATRGLPGSLGPAPAPPPRPWEPLKHTGPGQEVQLLQRTRCPVPPSTRPEQA